MENLKLKPARLVIKRFGGIRELARKFNDFGHPVHFSSISRWCREKERGGSDGHIPGKHHQALMAMAKKHRVKLKAEELIYGGR